MLKVIEFKEVGPHEAVVVLESDSPPPTCHEELRSREARDMAIQEARTRGYHNAGVSDFPNIYPVGSEGARTMSDLVKMSGNIAYRAEIKIACPPV